MKIKNLLAVLAPLALTVATLFGTASCSKDFIDLRDPTRIPTDEAYRDSLSFVNGVTAAYSSLQDIYGRNATNVGLFLFTEVASDNSTAVVTDLNQVGDFETFSFSANNPRIQAQWLATYRSIARCNLVLNRLPAAPLRDTTKNRFSAELKFIRALAYFNAVQVWGDVPLVTSEISTIGEAYSYGRQPTTAVYAQIEKDLKEAIRSLPNVYSLSSTADLGRVTRGAARGLLAKVYLTQRKYAEAETSLREFLAVYDNGIYALQPNYANIFLTSNEMNSEIIFAVRYSKGALGIGSPFTNYFAPTVAQAGGNGAANQYNNIRRDLVDAFTLSGAADTRGVASYGGPVLSSVYYTKKYLDTPTASYDADNDWIVLRYADVLLMYAEVLNELNRPTEAVPLLNRVRTRAGLPGLATSLNQNDLRLAIERDRRLELNTEGHRWFDLVRTGRAIAVMNAHFTRYSITLAGSPVTIDAHNLVFPIPLQEIQVNPALTQNPGYTN